MGWGPLYFDRILQHMTPKSQYERAMFEALVTCRRLSSSIAVAPKLAAWTVIMSRLQA